MRHPLKNQLARTPIVAALLVVLCMPAAAQNWIGLLKNTPAENFTEEDLKLFLDASRKALNRDSHGPDRKVAKPGHRQRW